MRLKGNELFERKVHDFDAHEFIWQRYTMAIALAPTKSEELAIACTNRSALLLHLLNITDSNLSKAKWLCRKAKCFHAPDDLPSAHKLMQEAKGHIELITHKNKDHTKVLTLIELTEKLISKKYSNPSEKFNDPKMPELNIETEDFSNVTDKYSPKLGRHLVTTRDIAPGEVIYVEELYSVSILHSKKAYPFCSHCHAACLTTIPCDLCSSVMFCSEKCKTDAWNEYHDIECYTLADYMKGNSTDKNPTEKVIIDGNLKMNKFLKLCQLVATESSFTLDNYSDIALHTLISLALNTTFFGKKFNAKECKILSSNKDIVFLGSLIYRITTFVANGIEISNIRDLMRRRTGRNFTIGAAIPSVFTCFVKHSCDPNASKIFNQASTLAVYALRPIKQGEKILAAYVDNYRIQDKFSRQMYLLEYHQFTCNCRACKENWPPLLNTTDSIMMMKPKNYEKKLFKTPLELELYRKHEPVIAKNYQPIYNFVCTQKMLSDLARSIETALKEIPQPSAVTCFLLAALNLVSSHLYSYVYPISDNCVTNKFSLPH
ncbi:uncharacterized protein LOC106646009 [Copidosoma floridanum]|uniref:uncharacterized protein LOC106646009 n=1 Tax=Copidosoma floridanum TaxID=29053 RepID=UPI000C6F8212|nr:uncharacterized protein LOC106646009 [Copidosoma floridanum]